MTAGDLPSISIVTPNLNYGRYLDQCVSSVLSQGYPRLEYAVMDAGSQDDSVAIIKRHSASLAHWRSRPDEGPYAAVNEGFARSTGEVLGWLNSDDIYLPGALHTVGDIFRTRPDVQWLTTTMAAEIACGGETTVLSLPGVSRESFLAGRHLIGYRRRGYTFIQQESTFFRRSLWNRSGGLRPDLKLAADYALWCSFWRHADLYLVDALIGAFRNHEQNRSSDLTIYLKEARPIQDELQRQVGYRDNLFRSLLAGTRWGRAFRLSRVGGYAANVLQRPTTHAMTGWTTSVRRFL